MTVPVHTPEDSPARTDEATAGPMTGTLMARLFIVPAVIVCILLAVAVVVVLFGSTAIEKQETVADLLTRLESDSGDRTMGAMLMPKAKESWQAAQELAQRLAERDKFLAADAIEPTAARIVALLEKFPPGRDVEEEGPAQEHFLMLALGQLGADSSVDALTRMLKDPNWSNRRTALQALALMHGSSKARQSLPAVIALLDDPKPAVQIVACATIAGLADPKDESSRRALAAKLEADREIQWNAAMALARLGDSRGKMVLMNMLDRGYWEKLDLEYTEDNSVVHRKYTPGEVANNLQAAIEAAAHLQGSDLSELIAKLRDDPAVSVRDAARTAASKMAMKKDQTSLRFHLPGPFAMYESEVS